LPTGIDWVCVSPKARAELVVRTGDELKLIYPQDGAEPERYEGLFFRHFFLQPMDGPERGRNTKLALNYCLEHPQWRLSLQTHKSLDIPCPEPPCPLSIPRIGGLMSACKRTLFLVASLLIVQGPEPHCQAAPPRTDASGDRLPQGAVRRLGSSPLRHPGDVCSLAFSPDGNTPATL